MNTYVVYSHQYGGKDRAGDGRKVDRIQAEGIQVRQADPEVVVTFTDSKGLVIGVVRDFDAIYLESAVNLETETDRSSVAPQ